MKSRFINAVFCAMILSVSVYAYAADQELKPYHVKAGAECVDCHGTKTPDSGAEEASCLGCHGSREDLTKLTEKLDPNPHFGHEEGLTCNSCHREHEESVLYCDDCHKWDLKTP